MNEVHQDTGSTLEDLKTTVVAVRESQERMWWWAIDGMSKEVQELVQGDAGTDGGEDTQLMPANLNLAEGGIIPAAESRQTHSPIL